MVEENCSNQNLGLQKFFTLKSLSSLDEKLCENIITPCVAVWFPSKKKSEMEISMQEVYQEVFLASAPVGE